MPSHGLAAMTAYRARLEGEATARANEHQKADVVRYILTGGAPRYNQLGVAGDGVEMLVQGMRGTEVFNAMRSGMASLSMDSTALQADVQNNVMLAMMPQLYKSDWDTHRESICAYWGVQDHFIGSKFALKCQRRAGKTMSLAMLTALLLRYCDGLEILVITTGQRTSTAFAETTRGFLDDIRGDAFVANNKESVTCYPDGDRHRGTRNVLRLVPSNAKTVRGVSAQLVIVDEAGFVPLEMFENVAYPLAMVHGTVLVALSSPSEDDGGAFNAMFEAKMKDGRKVFRTIEISNVCTNCQKTGNMDCTHVTQMRPQWQSKEALEELRALYKHSNPEAYNREISGADNGHRVVRAFPDAHIDALRDRPVHKPDFRYRRVYVSVDPSGGGSGSDTGIVVIAEDHTGVLVVRSGGVARGGRGAGGRVGPRWRAAPRSRRGSGRRGAGTRAGRGRVPAGPTRRAFYAPRRGRARQRWGRRAAARRRRPARSHASAGPRRAAGRAAGRRAPGSCGPGRSARPNCGSPCRRGGSGDRRCGGRARSRPRCRGAATTRPAAAAALPGARRRGRPACT
jgi:hypothetical protein